MTFKLVATDLDGTLRADYAAFTPRVKEAIRCAQERGVRVVIATGRMFRTSWQSAAELELGTPVVCNHGATIRNWKTGEILLQNSLPLDLAREALALTSDVSAIVCIDDEFYVPRVTENIERFVSTYRDYLHVAPDLAQSLNRAPQKIVYVNEIEIAAQLLPRLRTHFGESLQVVQSHPRYVELTHREATKGKAIEWLTKRWDIAREQVIAMGDQGNDCSMIEWAGLGVAMGNAIESLKAIADYVAPSAADDGAAHVIEKFILSDNHRIV